MKNPNIGDRRALASRVAERLQGDYGTLHYLGSYTPEPIPIDTQELVDKIVEELDEYFGPIKRKEQ